MAEKLPITDGTWWHAKSAVWVRCLICDRLHKTRPAVLRYIPEHDFSKDWNKKYPGIEKNRLASLGDMPETGTRLL